MSKTTTFLLAVALTSAPAALLAQSQSPDQQQPNSTNKPSPKATQPQTGTSDTAQPQSGQSPDIQQQKSASTDSKQHKKNKNNARQAHGTPKPKTDTATDH